MTMTMTSNSYNANAYSNANDNDYKKNKDKTALKEFSSNCKYIYLFQTTPILIIQSKFCVLV